MKKFLTKHYDKLILLAWCLVPLVWYIGKGTKIINGLDTNFPLDPLVWFQRRFFVWNDTVNAGIDASSSTSGWFFHLVQVIPYLAGFSIQTTQIISIIFWFSALVLSAHYFARAITTNKIAQLSFTFIYSFNIYLFNTWENVKVANLALVVGIPLLLGLIQRLVSHKLSFKVALVTLIPISVLTAGSGINPAYFIAIFAIALMFSVFLVLSQKLKRQMVIQIGTIFVFYVLLNLYWMIPFLRYLLVSVSASSFEQIGFSNWVDSLSENTSLLNVIRLQGAWDWYTLDTNGLPIYIPYAVNYFYRLPFVVFSFVVPFLTVVSLAFRNSQKKALYLFFSLCAIVGIFMGAGSHEPTGALFTFFIRYIPYFSFFRSPWYIFTPYLTFAYAALVALLVENIYNTFSKKNYSIAGFTLKPIIVVTIIVSGFGLARVLYLYPIFTGKIYRVDKPDSFFVDFPDYVYEAKDLLSNGEYSNRVITYPDDQLEQFDWGYRGTESILGLLTKQEVIAPSFAFVDKATQPVLGEFYKHLKKGQYQSALSMMPFLNVDTLFVKNDSSSLSRKITTVPKTQKVSVGMWDFYSLPSTQSKIYSPESYYRNTSNDATLAKVLPLLSSESAIVNANDTQVNKITNIVSHSSLISQAENISYDQNPSSNHHTYALTIPADGVYTIAIETKGVDFDDVSITSDSLSFEGISVEQTDSFYLINNLRAERGTHLLDIVYPEQNNLITQAAIKSVYVPPAIRPDELPEDPRTLVAYNRGIKDGENIKILAQNFDPYVAYTVSFDYKYFYGGVPFVKVLQSHSSAPLKVESIYTGSDTDWTSVSYDFDPVEIDSKLEIDIETPLKQYENTSKTFIENLTVKRLYDNDVFVIGSNTETYDSPPTVTFEKVSPVSYRVKVSGTSEDYPLIFSENYSPDWVLRGKGVEKSLHFTANGYANGWFIPASIEPQMFTIYYKNQDYYLYGLILSGISILAIAVYRFRK